MRLLFFSDLHLAERPPLARTHAYADELFEKLEAVREAAAECDVTIFGGDWWHWNRPPETPHRLVRRCIEFLRTWPTELFMVAGNHDLPSEGMAGLSRMPLGVLLEAFPHGPVRLLNDDASVTTRAGRYQLSALHWQPDVERRSDLFKVERHPSAAGVVKVVHALVMPPGGGWPFPAIGMDEIETAADVVLIGHPHWQTGVHRVNGTLFVGPGAVARTSRSASELERRPSFAIVEFWPDGAQARLVEIGCAKPASDIFLWTEPRPTVGRSEMFAGYVAALEAGLQLEGLSVEEVLASVAKNVEPEVAAIVKSLLEQAGL